MVNHFFIALFLCFSWRKAEAPGSSRTGVRADMNRKGFGLYGNAEPEISCHPAHCTMERWDFGTPQRLCRNDSGHCVIHAFFTAPIPSSSFIPIIFQKGGQRIPSFSFHRHQKFSDKKHDFLKSFQHSCCRFPKILRFR